MNTYETDFHRWIEEQSACLRSGQLARLDVPNLIEELDAMGRRERNELVSRLIVLLAHLLKWQYQPEHRSRSWRGSIVEQRIQVERELRLSPSLKPFLAEAIAEAYPDARHIAAAETGLSPGVLPVYCPYQAGLILAEDYWPEPAPD